MVERNESQSINKQYDTSSYEGKYDDVKRKFDSFDPSGINEACTTWSNVARLLGGIANTMHASAGRKLSDAWESDSSAQAQHHLQVAQATAQALADQCMQMARATDTAYQYANWYKTHFPGAGLVTLHDDHQRAIDHEVKLLGRYNEVIGILPDQVRAQYVDTNTNLSDDFTRTGGAGGAGAGSHLPGGAGTHLPGSSGSHLPGSAGTHLPGGGGTHTPGGSGFPGGGSGSGAGGTGSPYDPGSLLAGGGGGAGGIGAGLGPDGLGAGGVGSGLGSGAGGVGSGLGSGGGGFGPGGPGTGGAGRGGRFGTGEPEGAGGRGAGGRGAAGSGASPMHGGHGGSDEEERERTTWLTEDEDVWGGGTDVPPPVIGG